MADAPPPQPLAPDLANYVAASTQFINYVNMAAGPGNAAILLEIQQTLQQILQQMGQALEQQRIMSLDVMRMYNRGASLDAQVRYPLQTDHAGLEILAETKMEAITISGPDAAEALELLGVPDPGGDVERRRQFLTYIGI